MAVVLGGLVPHPPLLVPEVGGHRLAQVETTRLALEELCREVRSQAPERLVLITPHGPYQRSRMSCLAGPHLRGTLARFGCPEVSLEWPCDEDFCHRLDHEVDLVEAELDHALMVPLYFLRQAGLSCPLVALSVSGLPRQAHLALGRSLARLATTPTVVLASGDLSHRLKADGPYGYDPRGPRFDAAVVQSLEPLDPEAISSLDEDLVEGAGVCGLKPLLVLLGAMPRARGKVLSYEGPFGVGYAVARLEPPVDPAGLAREAVETFVREGRELELSEPPEGMQAPCGTFVTLKTDDGELRGCIGTLAPTTSNRAAEIVRNAVAACSRDPRFPPVQPQELDRMTYSVYLLDPPEPAQPEQLDPAVFGVIIRSPHGKSGVLLPGIPGLDTVERQLSALRKKAGLSASEPVTLERFRVHRFGEDD